MKPKGFPSSKNMNTQATTQAEPCSDTTVGSNPLLAESLLRQMIEMIEAHEVTCFSCDRDGEQYCDCMKRMVKNVKSQLKANARSMSREDAR